MRKIISMMMMMVLDTQLALGQNLDCILGANNCPLGMYCRYNDDKLSDSLYSCVPKRCNFLPCPDGATCKEGYCVDPLVVDATPIKSVSWVPSNELYERLQIALKPPAPVCGEHMEYVTCKSSSCFEDTCESFSDPNALRACTMDCKSGCACLPGYIRFSAAVPMWGVPAGVCRPAEVYCPLFEEASKPENYCMENEEFTTCGSSSCWEDTCESLKNPFRACTEDCQQGCRCKNGYVRSGGICVLGSTQCANTPAPPNRCGVNEEYTTCGSSSCWEDTCESLEDPFRMCTADCQQGCRCKDGYVRVGAMCVLGSTECATTGEKASYTNLGVGFCRDDLGRKLSALSGYADTLETCQGLCTTLLSCRGVAYSSLPSVESNCALYMSSYTEASNLVASFVNFILYPGTGGQSITKAADTTAYMCYPRSVPRPAVPPTRPTNPPLLPIYTSPPTTRPVFVTLPPSPSTPIKSCSNHRECGQGNYCFSCRVCLEITGFNFAMCGTCANTRGGSCGPAANCARDNDSINGVCP